MPRALYQALRHPATPGDDVAPGVDATHGECHRSAWHVDGLEEAIAQQKIRCNFCDRLVIDGYHRIEPCHRLIVEKARQEIKVSSQLGMPLKRLLPDYWRHGVVGEKPSVVR